MDIVHLIETKIIKSTQEETSSHTYAEIERTIALDHSEGTQANVNMLLYCYVYLESYNWLLSYKIDSYVY